MRRYIFSGSIKGLEVLEYDVLIVGSGIAGLYAGLHIDPEMRTAIVTKGDFDKSNSWLAQGGIAAVIDSSDNFDSHVEDTLKAGAGLCDPAAVEVLVHEGPENIAELVELNVPFDTNPEGELMITREGGHSCRRIVHCGGDATGRETTRRLGELALERKNLDMLMETYLIDILTEDNAVVGAIVFDKKPKLIKCPSIIMATGGIGALYDHTTNPAGAIGDGIAAAQRAGARVVNMELVQFHPTTLTPCESDSTDRRFLISEAVRGEGGILRNHDGEAFMQGKHELADLAPRDIVTREIIKELRRTGKSHVFLDVSCMSEEFFAKRFPTIYSRCCAQGIKVPEMWIPVCPSQHYLMGGINTDLNGMTDVEGLYACGECAWTGIHGANRLASNSMLECLVFSRRAATHINIYSRGAENIRLNISDKPLSGGAVFKLDTDKKRRALRSIMTEKANAVRTRAGMEECKAFVDALLCELEGADLECREQYELYAMAQMANAIIGGALSRTDSVGAHYIES